MSDLAEAIARRRTFAIISHPDAGKTTLTEKLLLFGGAIQLAGTVKARGERRRARSDWLQVEQERGISVASSVMTFDYAGTTFNLLDTPGHEDFSEDTYRTLTAVDSAVMVLDAAKGIESQTRKLFEVCRLRDVPILTFINKMDREARDPFELLDEVESDLALDAAPVSWPIGMGRDFRGCYDLVQDRVLLFDRGSGEEVTETVEVAGIDDGKLDELLPEHQVAELREQVAMVRELCPPFDLESYRAGTLTPVFFGSALNNFGVREVLAGLHAYAPPPGPQTTDSGPLPPDSETTAGYVFKVQANMDPQHRDQVAFLRLCSGKFKRGMKLRHGRTGKLVNLHNPLMFLARERETAEEAYPGDIIGIRNHGALRIGDTLASADVGRFTGVPSFAPELLQRVRVADPMKAKHLRRALDQLAGEGAAQVFKPLVGADWVVGVVGALQFDILAQRLKSEYNVAAKFEPANLMTARWVETPDHALARKIVDQQRGDLAEDHDGALVFLARNQWHLDRFQQDWPQATLNTTREQNKPVTTAA